MGATLVLGNGFDLGLGWHTGYLHFYKSGFFPSLHLHRSSNMCAFMHNAAMSQGENWGGIEASLEEYAMLPESQHTFQEDRSFYMALLQSLKLYFLKELYHPCTEGSLELFIPKDESCSCCFLREGIFFDQVVNNVISFNYTDFKEIASIIAKEEFVGLDETAKQRVLDGLNCIYIHRALPSTMVLGISNDAKLFDNRYDFLKKSHISVAPCFTPVLLSSEIVIFWGFSFSKCDQPYFRDYFRHISSGATGISHPNKLYFVGFDDDSNERVKCMLEQMMNGDLTALFANNEVSFVNANKGIESRNFSRMLLDLRLFAAGRQ